MESVAFGGSGVAYDSVYGYTGKGTYKVSDYYDYVYNIGVYVYYAGTESY